MKQYVKLLLPLAFLAIVWNACNKEGAGFININYAYYFGDSLLKSDVKYNFVSGGKKYQFRVDVMKMYVARTALVNSGNAATELKDVVLFNYKNGSNLQVMDTTPPGEYTSFKFIMGLDTTLNNSSPSSFPISHPLSTAQSMYWGMLKYRFVVMEGIIHDSTGKEIGSVSYHTGVNLSRAKISTQSFKVSDNQTTNILVKFDLEKVFTAAGNNIDPTAETFTHSSPGIEYDIAKKVMDNFASGTTITINP